MGKRIRDYVKYTFKELERYTKSKGSCVKKVNKIIHFNLPPYGLSKLKETVTLLINKKKIGLHDRELNGIILDVRNIKLLSDVIAIRFDSPSLHINLQADIYYFQPNVGDVVRGVVSHISKNQLGVILYRVFNVSIRLNQKINNSIELNSEIEFRIKNFELEGMMPYIEGELVSKEVELVVEKTEEKYNKDHKIELNNQAKLDNETWDMPDDSDNDDQKNLQNNQNHHSESADSDSSLELNKNSKKNLSKLNPDAQGELLNENKTRTDIKDVPDQNNLRSSIEKVFAKFKNEFNDSDSSTSSRLKRRNSNDISLSAKTAKRVSFSKTNEYFTDSPFKSQITSSVSKLKKQAASESDSEVSVNKNDTKTSPIENVRKRLSFTICDGNSLQTNGNKKISKKSNKNSTLEVPAASNGVEKISNDKPKPTKKPKKATDVNSQMMDILKKIKSEKSTASSTIDKPIVETLTSKSPTKKNSVKKKKKTKNLDESLMGILAKVKSEKSKEVYSDVSDKTPIKNKKPAKKIETDPISKPRKRRTSSKSDLEDSMKKILSQVKTEKFNASL